MWNLTRVVSIVPKRAMPKLPPICLRMLVRPEACAILRCGIWEIVTAESGAKMKPMPKPRMQMGIMIWPISEKRERYLLTKRLKAIIERPKMIGTRAPMRSLIAPAKGAEMAVSTPMGRKTMPACRGV